MAKKVGMFGSLSNSVQAAALVVERSALTAAEASAFALYKVIVAADEEVREANPASSWEAEKAKAIEIARLGLK